MSGQLRHNRLHRGAGLAFRPTGLEAGDGDLDVRAGGQAGEHRFGFFGQFLGQLGAGVVGPAGVVAVAAVGDVIDCGPIFWRSPLD